jgi:hypothetical protein
MSIDRFSAKNPIDFEPPLGAGVFPRKGEQKRLKEKLLKESERAKKIYSISKNTIFGLSPPLLRPILSFIPADAIKISTFWKNDQTIQKALIQFFIHTARSQKPIQFVDFIIENENKKEKKIPIDLSRLIERYAEENPYWLETKQMTIFSSKKESIILEKIAASGSVTLAAACFQPTVVPSEKQREHYFHYLQSRYILDNRIDSIKDLIRLNLLTTEQTARLIQHACRYEKPECLKILLRFKPVYYHIIFQLPEEFSYLDFDQEIALPDLAKISFDTLQIIDALDDEDFGDPFLKNIFTQSNDLLHAFEFALSSSACFRELIHHTEIPASFQVILFLMMLAKSAAGNHFDRKCFELLLKRKKLTKFNRSFLVERALLNLSPVHLIQALIDSGPVESNLITQFHCKKDQIYHHHSRLNSSRKSGDFLCSSLLCFTIGYVLILLEFLFIFYL